MSLLEQISSSRLEHGLRHSDYKRYANYCKKKKSALYQAERAWANAQIDFAVQEPRKRLHGIKRLRKAYRISLTIDSSDHQLAYTAGLLAELLFHQNQYGQSMLEYQKQLELYGKLESESKGLEKTLCQQKIEEIEPMIRYCAYQEGHSLEDLLELKNSVTGELQKLISKTLQNEIVQESFVWRHHEIVADREVMEMKLTIDNLVKHLDQPSSDLFDKIIGMYWELTSMVKTELDSNLKAAEIATSTKTTELIENLNNLYAYVVTERVNMAITRNLFLIQSLDTVESIKMLLQTIKSLKEYDDIQQDSNFIIYKETLEKYLVCYKKALFVKFYLEKNEFSKAKVMLDQSSSLLEDIKQEMIIDDLMQDLQPKLDQLQRKIQYLTCQLYSKYVYTRDLDITLSLQQLNKPKVLNLQKATVIDSAPTLVDFQISLKPVVNKPIFYDLGYDLLEFPVDNLAKDKRVGIFETKKKGFFGLF
ncbi:signal recognition particle subunit srp68 [Boothiomyces sp. JEL0838]|nr:signal recognition particle subunit srp68 [Boothiomyces sp. JEL0838]